MGLTSRHHSDGGVSRDQDARGTHGATAPCWDLPETRLLVVMVVVAGLLAVAVSNIRDVVEHPMPKIVRHSSEQEDGGAAALLRAAPAAGATAVLQGLVAGISAGGKGGGGGGGAAAAAAAAAATGGQDAKAAAGTGAAAGQGAAQHGAAGAAGGGSGSAAQQQGGAASGAAPHAAAGSADAKAAVAAGGGEDDGEGAPPPDGLGQPPVSWPSGSPRGLPAPPGTRNRTRHGNKRHGDAGAAHVAASLAAGRKWHWPRGAAPLGIAHRGASAELPEHTLEAYRLAVEEGADIIECDVVLSADLVPHCRHEPNLANSTDALQVFPDRARSYVIDGERESGVFITDLTAAEVATLRAVQPWPFRDQSHNGRYRVATLQQYLEVAKSANRSVGIYPETKHPTWTNALPHVRAANTTLEDILLRALAEAGFAAPPGSHRWRRHPVFIQSFEAASLRYMAARTCAPMVLLLGDWEGWVAPDSNLTLAQLTTDESLEEIATWATAVGASKRSLLTWVDGGAAGGAAAAAPEVDGSSTAAAADAGAAASGGAGTAAAVDAAAAASAPAAVGDGGGASAGQEAAASAAAAGAPAAQRALQLELVEPSADRGALGEEAAGAGAGGAEGAAGAAAVQAGGGAGLPRRALRAQSQAQVQGQGQGHAVAELKVQVLASAGGRYASSGLVEKFHKHGLEVHTYTLRPEQQFFLPHLAEAAAGGGGANASVDVAAEYDLLMRAVVQVDAVFTDHMPSFREWLVRQEVLLDSLPKRPGSWLHWGLPRGGWAARKRHARQAEGGAEQQGGEQQGGRQGRAAQEVGARGLAAQGQPAPGQRVWDAQMGCELYRPGAG